MKKKRNVYLLTTKLKEFLGKKIKIQAVLGMIFLISDRNSC